MTKENNFMKNIVYVLVIGVFAMFFAMLFINVEEDENTISLSGDAQNQVAPDEFSLSVGVSERGENVAELESSVKEKMTAITNGLKELGFNESELKTQQFRVNEEYRSVEQRTGPQEYRVTQTLEISSSKMDLISSSLNTSLSLGANSVSSLSFGLSEEKESSIKDELLDDAFNSAKQKAEILAESSDSQLGGVISIEVQDYSYSPYRTDYDMAESGSAGSNMPTIEQGEVDVETAVSVVFEIK